MTTFLRFGTDPIPDRISSECPTLAAIQAHITERTDMMRSDPIYVDEITFIRAEKEMKALREARGYTDLARAHIAQRNFLLFGVPIVTEGDSDG